VGLGILAIAVNPMLRLQAYIDVDQPHTEELYYAHAKTRAHHPCPFLNSLPALGLPGLSRFHP
jgi:hypothetical protein